MPLSSPERPLIGHPHTEYMTRRVAGFLVALGAFMVVEWTNLAFNLTDGHPTSFYVIHGILIAVNIVLGLALTTVGVRGWTSGRESQRETHPTTTAAAQGRSSSSHTRARA